MTDPTDTRARLIAAAGEELAGTTPGSLSLRAVARRADLSHAAPAHFFGDRAGLLTAVATDGFRALTARLVAAGDDVAAQGRAYVDFGAEHPALIDLMFRGTDLHPDDPALQQAKRDAIGRLMAAVATAPDAASADTLSRTLMSWALVHGLVVLAREGMLAPFGGPHADDRSIARDLIDRYTAAALG